MYLDEKTFRRWESAIRDAVVSYPTAVEVHSTMAASTTLSQLRSAKKFLLTNPSTVTFIDYSRFLEIYDSLQVRQSSGRIFLGPAASLLAATTSASPSRQPTSCGTAPYAELVPHLTSILHLYNAGHLTLPFVITRATADDINSLVSLAETYYNVALSIKDSNIIIQ